MRSELTRARPLTARAGFAAALALLLAGCGGGPAGHDTPVQVWRDLQVHVESRASVFGTDTQELLVYVNRGVVPAWDCRVEVRTSPADPWKQAIEDGRVAVYRRATQVDAGAHAVAEVRIRAEGDEVVLKFPLTP
jgi:hypothetical protein